MKTKNLIVAIASAASIFSTAAVAQNYDGTFNLLSLIAAAHLMGDKDCVKVATDEGFVKKGLSAPEMLKELPAKDVPANVKKSCGDALAVAMNLTADMWLVQAEDGCLLKDGTINPETLHACPTEQVADERVIGRHIARNDKRYLNMLLQFEETKLEQRLLNRITAMPDGEWRVFQDKILAHYTSTTN